MPRYIDADALAEKKFQEPECKGFDKGVAYRCGWNDAIDAIMDNEPSADLPVRNTAEWIYGEKDGADGWYCSKCGFHIPWYYDYYGLKNINFIRDFHTCPHCDAKMLKYTGKDGEQGWAENLV